MKIDLSAAEIGVIVSALEYVYQDGSPELDLAHQLCDNVYEFLGDDYYNQWADEFDSISA